MSDPIRVIVVDDHPLVRDGVVAALEPESDIEVVGQGATADDAVHLAQDLLPDVILLDIAMPGGGLNAVQIIAESCPVSRIIMLTSFEDETHVLAALRAGARGYVIKGVTGRELRSIVRGVHRGEVFVSPSLAAGVLSQMASGSAKTPTSLLDDLTPREHSILELVAAGCSNKQIAVRLELTENTVKGYMTNILQKLQVRNRVEAALLAERAARSQHLD
jgi:two-component system, NarL family, nitrate/nitrite response regulator NarL